MIRLKRGDNNLITPTLTEKTTISSPKYLFEFVNESNTPSYCICATNTSGDTGRYDEFSITETNNPTPTASQIKLEDGQYKYIIYQQASTTNLNPKLTSGEVESGICFVYTNPNTYIIKTNSPSITNKVNNV